MLGKTLSKINIKCCVLDVGKMVPGIVLNLISIYFDLRSWIRSHQRLYVVLVN